MDYVLYELDSNCKLIRPRPFYVQDDIDAKWACDQTVSVVPSALYRKVAGGMDYVQGYVNGVRATYQETIAAALAAKA